MSPLRPPSAKLHSRYQRTLADAAIGGRRVLIRLAARRFLCHHPIKMLKRQMYGRANLDLLHKRVLLSN